MISLGALAQIDFLLFAALTFWLAGLVKGTIGMGLPTVAVGLLGTMMPPTQAAALVLIPALGTNIWQLAAGPSLRSLLRRLWSLLLGVCLGTWLAGIVLATHGAWEHARLALGLALIFYALLGLARVHWHTAARHEIWSSPVAGAVTGALTVATGVFVIPAVPYLQSLKLDKDEMVQALGLSFTASSIALAPVLLQNRILDGTVAMLSLLALLPALIGMAIGQRLRGLASPEQFRLLFFSGLLGLGVYLSLSA